MAEKEGDSPDRGNVDFRSTKGLLSHASGLRLCALLRQTVRWTVCPTGNLQANFLPIQIPLYTQTKNKPETNSDLSFVGGERGI